MKNHIYQIGFFFFLIFGLFQLGCEEAVSSLEEEGNVDLEDFFSSFDQNDFQVEEEEEIVENTSPRSNPQNEDIVSEEDSNTGFETPEIDINEDEVEEVREEVEEIEEIEIDEEIVPEIEEDVVPENDEPYVPEVNPDNPVGENDQGGILPPQDHVVPLIPGIVDHGIDEFVEMDCFRVDPADFINSISTQTGSRQIIRGDSTSISWQFREFYNPSPVVSLKKNGRLLTSSTSASGTFNIQPDRSTIYQIEFSYCGRILENRDYHFSVWNWQVSALSLPRNRELVNISESQDRSYFQISTLNTENRAFPIPTVFQSEDFSQNLIQIYQGVLGERLPNQVVDLINSPIKTVLYSPEGCGGDLSYYSTEGFIFRTTMENGEEQILGSSPDDDIDHVGNDDHGPLLFLSREGERFAPSFMFNDPTFPEMIYYAQPDGLAQLDDCSSRNDLNFTRDFPIFNDRSATDYAVIGDDVFILSDSRLIAGKILLGRENQRSWREIFRREGGYQWIESGERHLLAGQEDQILMYDPVQRVARFIEIRGLITAKEVLINNISYVVALTQDGLFLNVNRGSQWIPLNSPQGFENVDRLYSLEGQPYLWAVDESLGRIFKLDLGR